MEKNKYVTKEYKTTQMGFIGEQLENAIRLHHDREITHEESEFAHAIGMMLCQISDRLDIKPEYLKSDERRVIEAVENLGKSKLKAIKDKLTAQLELINGAQ
jgi:hypothetical protein